MSTIETIPLTAEEYRLMPDTGQPTELVRGHIVMMNMPGARHGKICARIVRIMGDFVDARELGHVMCNDTGIVTDRGPDTVRGADVAYYSYARLPKDADLEGYPPVAPELVFEVRSPSDAWKSTLAKVAEYLNAGVSVACVVDPKKDRVQLFYPDRESETVLGDQELRLPDLLPGFNVFVRDFFE